MQTQRVWLSFDLGVRGDYDGIYQWLDEHDAVECGNGIATFEFSFSDKAISAESYEPMFEELKKDLQKNVNDIESRGRVYALTLIKVEGTNHPAGVFIFGKRKISPWAGYANNGNFEPDV